MAKNKSNKFPIALFAALSITACGESVSETKTAEEKPAKLEQLITQAKDLQAKADKLGFEWSNTQLLFDLAKEAQESNDLTKAHDLYLEAKFQSELAITQAEYAKEHWQLLIPSN